MAASIEQILDHAATACQQQGSRLTPKRKLVLNALLSSKKALSAYELIDLCQQQFAEKLAPMSMYRILEFLEQEGLIHKLYLANKYIACAHIACSHQHQASQFLICQQCYQVKEINIQRSTQQDLAEHIVQAGFHMISPQLEIHCLCNDCYQLAALPPSNQ